MQQDLERTNHPRDREAGQTMAEYAVVLAIITVVIVASLTVFGDAVAGLMDAITGILD